MHFLFLDQLSIYKNYRPFAPYVEVSGINEIKVTWLPVSGVGTSKCHYELYNNDELEYVGLDIIYIAKRLHPEREYAFRLRVCSEIPDDCSQFSIPRYQEIKGMLHFY